MYCAARSTQLSAGSGLDGGVDWRSAARGRLIGRDWSVISRLICGTLGSHREPITARARNGPLHRQTASAASAQTTSRTGTVWGLSYVLETADVRSGLGRAAPHAKGRNAAPLPACCSGHKPRGGLLRDTGWPRAVPAMAAACPARSRFAAARSP
jgi:hypothetical protein